MKIAVVYNRDSKSVINLFGMPNQERIGRKTISRIVDALKAGGHNAIAMEGDKELVEKLEQFMPRVLKGENPGMVFNLSYGIQGQARYTHVPGILEMVGIPYVGSGPLAHSLALDKVVSKIIFKQNGIPTADFVVLKEPGFDPPDLPYPLIVKPKNEAVSFGIRIVRNLTELREAVRVIFEQFSQPVLAETYIKGREINVGLLGNDPPWVLPPAEIVFPKRGPRIYTYEDKTNRSDRTIRIQCPAKLTSRQTGRVKEIALSAFSAVGCNDCARVDMRLDHRGKFYVLEMNSLPSLGEHGSYTHAAAFAGLDYPALVNKLVDVASARYFGTPRPPVIEAGTRDPSKKIFSFITKHRDHIEKRLHEWIRISSRTSDPVGLREVRRHFRETLAQLGMVPVPDLCNEHSAATWQTKKGLEGGTLLILHLDVPLSATAPTEPFHRDPEWLYGEGVGVSRAPVVMLEFALQALRSQRFLQHIPLGVLFYTDEGREAVYSRDVIRAAAARVQQVLVLRPGNMGDYFVRQRRGQRKYDLSIEGKPRRLGSVSKQTDTLIWFTDRVGAITRLTSRKDRIAVAAVDVKVSGFPMLLPHRVKATLLLSFLDARKADAYEVEIRRTLGKDHVGWTLELVSDRPAMKDRVANRRLAKILGEVAAQWKIDLRSEYSLWPSVGGLVTGKTSVACGLGPVARNIYTPRESVQRISLIQRTLLLSQFLLTIHG